MQNATYVGTTPVQDINKTVSPKAWGNVYLPEVPYKVVAPPPTYLASIGSANTSLATTSDHGITYNSGFDLFRWDNDYTVVDVDRYLASPQTNYYNVYKVNPPHHHLQFSDEIIDCLPLQFQHLVRNAIRK